MREGGFRIGVVDDMRPVPLPNGEVGALAVLKLDKKTGAVPRDSQVTIRPRSVLGLKYVELQRGQDSETFRDGDTIPVGQARLPVELDQFQNIFDERTRQASQENLRGFGNAFAERGLSLNRTIEELPRFLGYLTPVARVLAERYTELDMFFRELGDAARVVAPVAGRYSHSFSAGADTFEAWSRDPEALKETISRSVPSLRAGIRSFPVQRPFLHDFARFSRALKRATDELPRTLPRITPALRAGIPVLRKTPTVNVHLRRAFDAMRVLFSDARTNVALRGLTALVNTLNPTLRFVGPYITVCNYFNYAWTNAAEHLTEPDPTGFAQRTLLNQFSRTQSPSAPSPGTLGASQPINGEPTIPPGVPMNLHLNIYTAAVDERGNADCESGQRGYGFRRAQFAPPGFNVAWDPHIAGNSGPTFTGRPRVLPGQTFTRTPQQGPQMPSILINP